MFRPRTNGNGRNVLKCNVPFVTEKIGTRKKVGAQTPTFYFTYKEIYIEN